MTVHVVIPDTQVKPGVPMEHLAWASRYIVDNFAGQDNVTVVHLGDHWDFESLSSYDKGKKAMEGRRVLADLEAGNQGMVLLNSAIEAEAQRRRRNKEKAWKIRKVILGGNHEDRLFRAVENDPQLDGIFGQHSMDTLDWEHVPFLTPIVIDGIAYCHFFMNPLTGRPHGGVASTKLKTVGCSYTQGHVQVFDYAERYVMGARHQGLTCGAFYLHDEAYKGVQGNDHYRGIIVKRFHGNGYDLQQVSMDQLRERYS